MTKRRGLSDEWHRRVRDLYRDAERTMVLTIPSVVLSSPARRAEFFREFVSRVSQLRPQIIRMSTTLEHSGAIDREDMEHFVEALLVEGDSSVWGLNMGECICTPDAWALLEWSLPHTYVGFMWINERGKFCGLSDQDHRRWLQRDGSLLCGKGSVLAKNRLKDMRRDTTMRPYEDPSNPVFREAVSAKFLFNPMSRRAFQLNATRGL